ncbi:DUF4882 family protein [Acinetobacter haemolyticus]|nr:DUF4882 family protein [Acinetobacter haemolyticus]EEH68133.1 hypothetical protein HMPREF0023_2339 [Acinetobacter sp. ATCC 27244]
MFITSFGEQNITYKCCSNFLIHLYSYDGSGITYDKFFEVSATPTGYQRLGVYINQDTKQVGAIFNGINYGYVGTASTKPVNYFFEMNLGQYAIPAGNPVIGQEISQELVLDRSQLQFTYPAGTKDLCGTVL